MQKKLIICMLSALLYLPHATFGQSEPVNSNQNKKKESSVKLSGYVKDLATVFIPSSDSLWFFDNQVHNRYNIRWYTSKTITFTIEGRNRLYFGNSVQSNPDFENQVTASLDQWQLDWIVGKNHSYFFYANIDRLNIKWRKGRYQVTAGKQRINWGKSYVWNPNDVFNAYSFFDFDYEERRGTDAVLLKYTTSPLSSLEIASDYTDSFDSLTMAIKYNFNRWEYDFQVLSGKYLEDLFFAVGWAGQIKSAGFKGELSYFQPYRNMALSADWIASISFDYTFPNTLNFRLEGLFNSNEQSGASQINILEPVTAKTLIPNQWAAFGAIGYDITPLVVVNINGIYYIDDGSFFINPDFTFSLNKNTEFLIASQVFGGSGKSLFGGLGSFVFTRLKWSF